MQPSSLEDQPATLRPDIGWIGWLVFLICALATLAFLLTDAVLAVIGNVNLLVNVWSQSALRPSSSQRKSNGRDHDLSGAAIGYLLSSVYGIGLLVSAACYVVFG